MLGARSCSSRLQIQNVSGVLGRCFGFYLSIKKLEKVEQRGISATQTKPKEYCTGAIPPVLLAFGCQNQANAHIFQFCQKSSEESGDEEDILRK